MPGIAMPRPGYELPGPKPVQVTAFTDLAIEPYHETAGPPCRGEACLARVINYLPRNPCILVLAPAHAPAEIPDRSRNMNRASSIDYDAS